MNVIVLTSTGFKESEIRLLKDIQSRLWATRVDTALISRSQFDNGCLRNYLISRQAHVLQLTPYEIMQSPNIVKSFDLIFVYILGFEDKPLENFDSAINSRIDHKRQSYEVYRCIRIPRGERLECVDLAQLSIEYRYKKRHISLLGGLTGEVTESPHFDGDKWVIEVKLETGVQASFALQDCDLTPYFEIVF